MVKRKATMSMTPPTTLFKPLMAWRETTQPLQATSMHMLDKHANKKSTQQRATNMEGLHETVITTVVYACVSAITVLSGTVEGGECKSRRF